jgi:hypothetical protein
MTLKLNKEVIVMNKIKLLYDVVNTMKEKEDIKGALTVVGKKDQVKFLSINNQFQKNLVNGDVKAKINVVLDTEEKKVKHESEIEFNSNRHPGGRHCHFGSHFQHHRGGMRHHLKDKLSVLSFALKTLNDMQIDEQPDYSLITLNLKEIPEELKAIHSAMHQNRAEENYQHHEHHEHHDHHEHREHHEHLRHHFPMMQFISMEKTKAVLSIRVNKNNEVEKIDISAEGNQKDEQGRMHSLNLQGELQFSR